jgi:hypothetical protein
MWCDGACALFFKHNWGHHAHMSPLQILEVILIYFYVNIEEWGSKWGTKAGFETENEVKWKIIATFDKSPQRNLRTFYIFDIFDLFQLCTQSAGRCVYISSIICENKREREVWHMNSIRCEPYQQMCLYMCFMVDQCEVLAVTTRLTDKVYFG